MARRMLIALLVTCALPLFGVDWPVEKKIITGTFGENRGDHFHNGLDIGGGAQEVHPALPGELVFRYEENEDYTSLPRGVGSFVALHHGDNVETLYCHLERGSLGQKRLRYEAADRVGIIGDSGYSQGKHLHFIVFDEETFSFINPLSFLPPIADKQSPVIKRVFLLSGDQARPLTQGGTVPPGKTQVGAEVYDLREDVKFHWPLTPYGIRLSLDGKEVSKIVFDSLQVREGRMVLHDTRLSAENVYTLEGLVLCGSVELRRGESHLLLSARDFAGNETTREISFTVRE